MGRKPARGPSLGSERWNKNWVPQRPVSPHAFACPVLFSLPLFGGMSDSEPGTHRLLRRKNMRDASFIFAENYREKCHNEAGIDFTFEDLSENESGPTRNEPQHLRRFRNQITGFLTVLNDFCRGFGPF